MSRCLRCRSPNKPEKLVERVICTLVVAGSIPAFGSKFTTMRFSLAMNPQMIMLGVNFVEESDEQFWYKRWEIYLLLFVLEFESQEEL